jgi:hypothetical protein
MERKAETQTKATGHDVSCEKMVQPVGPNKYGKRLPSPSRVDKWFMPTGWEFGAELGVDRSCDQGATSLSVMLRLGTTGK